MSTFSRNISKILKKRNIIEEKEEGDAPKARLRSFCPQISPISQIEGRCTAAQSA
jgi:hypothetical protein